MVCFQFVDVYSQILYLIWIKMNFEKEFRGGMRVRDFLDDLSQHMMRRHEERPSVVLMHPEVYYRYRDEVMQYGRFHSMDKLLYLDVEVHESRDLEHGYVKMVGEKVSQGVWDRIHEQRMHEKERELSKIEMTKQEIDLSNHITDSQNYLRQALGMPMTESLNIKAPNPFFVRPDITPWNDFDVKEEKKDGLTFMQPKMMKLR